MVLTVPPLTLSTIPTWSIVPLFPQSKKIIIFFDWGNNGTIDHVGIVESVSGGTVNTIEGNSGDKVARRSYSIGSSNIYGYGVPAY